MDTVFYKTKPSRPHEFNGKAIELQEKGKGKRLRRADPLTAEEELLWSSGVLGGGNPSSLTNTIFFLFSQHLGTRGRQEHRQLRVEDLKIIQDAKTGQTAYIEWTEGPTKLGKEG